MREAAWAGASSTQKRSLIPSGMPQRSGASPCLQPRRRQARLVSRPLGRQRREGVERARGLRRREACLGQLDRADLARAQRAARLGDGQAASPAHSTTFGTVKKPARASGAFASTLSGMPPSLTTSSRQVELHRRHRGHRLDAVHVDLAQLLHEAEDAGQLRRQRPEIGLRHLDPGQMRHPARGLLVDRHGAEVSGARAVWPGFTPPRPPVQAVQGPGPAAAAP